MCSKRFFPKVGRFVSKHWSTPVSFPLKWTIAKSLMTFAFTIDEYAFVYRLLFHEFVVIVVIDINIIIIIIIIIAGDKRSPQS